jgi:hypothetical protein
MSENNIFYWTINFSESSTTILQNDEFEKIVLDIGFGELETKRGDKFNVHKYRVDN